MSKKCLFLTLLFLSFSPQVFAAPATVTNNGNIPVRVQSKTPDGQYQDLGQVKPGETVEVPGGVEKVRIVREPGEWAKPLDPGQVLDVVVKEGGQEAGRMDWWGDKVFFDGLTEAPPVTTPPPVTEPRPPTPAESVPPAVEPKTETPPAAPQEPAQPETEQPAANWPWTGGGMMDYFFFLQMFALFLPFLFLMLRNRFRPQVLDLDGVKVGKWQWGWGWQGSGCGMKAIQMGLVFGLTLGMLWIWGHGQFAGGNTGFFPRIGQDFFSFPYYLLGNFLRPTGSMADIFFVTGFWMVLMTGCGMMGSIMPISALYSAPALMMIAPFFLLMRGCAGGQAFGLDGGYGGDYDYYPEAWASGCGFVSMITTMLLDWADPYEEMSYDEEDDVWYSVYDFFHGNPWPLLVFLGGGCLSCFYGAVYEDGWNSAIGEFFHNTPLLLGLNFIPPTAMICIFWMLIFGGLGFCGFKDPRRLAFYACFTPAMLALIFLTAGNYPQKLRISDYYKYRIEAREYIRPQAAQIQLDPELLERIRNAAAIETADPVLKGPQPAVSMAPAAPANDKAWKVGGDFGDGFKMKARYGSMGSDVYFEDAQAQHQDGHHQSHGHAEAE